MNSKKKILVIEDNELFGKLVAHSLKTNGFDVDLKDSSEDLLVHMQDDEYNLILLDLYIGDKNMLDEFDVSLFRNSKTPIVFMSVNSSIEYAVKAIQVGAASFVNKNEDLLAIISAVETYSTKKSPTKDDFPLLDDLIIGKSKAMIRIKEMLAIINNINAPVLIQGETGTGKEVVAKAIHRISNRNAKPYFAINCGAIPENLLESELFGHAKGAFTDAKKDKPGLFETCSEGTLLLDEIGDMPFHLQVKLLRVLQEKEVTRIGESQPRKIDAHVLAATNVDLEKHVKSGRFREDLYYRLNVINIQLPPLRDRLEDIEGLAQIFLNNANQKYLKNFQIQKRQMDVLLPYNWPGNVRELQNIIEKSVILSRKSYLEITIPENRRPFLTDFVTNLTIAKNNFELQYLSKILSLANGNISLAAKIAGRHRGDIYRLMKKHQMDAKNNSNRIE